MVFEKLLYSFFGHYTVHVNFTKSVKLRLTDEINKKIVHFLTKNIIYVVLFVLKFKTNYGI